MPPALGELRIPSCIIKYNKVKITGTMGLCALAGLREPRAQAGLGRAGGSAARAGRRGGGISRNLSAAGPPAEEVRKVRGVGGPRCRASPAVGRGSGRWGLVGSGRGLELGGGLDARERGWPGTGVRTLGPPGAEPGRREVTAGILQP